MAYFTDTKWWVYIASYGTALTYHYFIVSYWVGIIYLSIGGLAYLVMDGLKDIIGGG